MLSQYAPIAVVVLGYLLYHSSQKSVSGQVNAFVTLMTAYSIALALCTTLFFLVPAKEGWSESIRSLNWANLAIGVAVVALEGGFLFAYRAGWSVSMTGLIANVSAALLLIPIGILVFKERITALNGLGILLALIGIVLMKWK